MDTTDDRARAACGTILSLLAMAGDSYDDFVHLMSKLSSKKSVSNKQSCFTRRTFTERFIAK